MKSSMTANHAKETALRLPTWLLIILSTAIIAWVVTIALYFSTFHASLSSDQSVWGQFGDYIGGTLNPTFAFMTFIALLYTIVLQGQQVVHAKQELDLAVQQLHLQAQDSRKQLTASVLLELRQIYSTEDMNRSVQYVNQLRRDSAAEFRANRYTFARKYVQKVDSASPEWVMRRRVSHFYADVAALVEAGCLDANDFFTSYGNSFEIVEFLEPIETAIAEKLDAMPYKQEWVAMRLLARGLEWQKEQRSNGIDPRFTLPSDPQLYSQSLSTP